MAKVQNRRMSRQDWGCTCFFRTAFQGEFNCHLENLDWAPTMCQAWFEALGMQSYNPSGVYILVWEHNIMLGWYNIMLLSTKKKIRPGGDPKLAPGFSSGLFLSFLDVIFCLSLTIGLVKGFPFPGPCHSTHYLWRSTLLSCELGQHLYVDKSQTCMLPISENDTIIFSEARNLQIFLDCTLFYPVLLTILVNSLKYLSNIFLLFHSE